MEDRVPVGRGTGCLRLPFSGPPPSPPPPPPPRLEIGDGDWRLVNGATSQQQPGALQQQTQHAQGALDMLQHNHCEVCAHTPFHAPPPPIPHLSTPRYARKKAPKSNTLPAAQQESQWPDSDTDDPDADDSSTTTSSSSNSRRPQLQQQQRKPAAKQTAAAGGNSSSSSGLGADAPCGDYSAEVVSSLHIVDPSLINYELIEALLVHIVSVQQHQGPTALLKVREGVGSRIEGARGSLCLEQLRLQGTGHIKKSCLPY
mgnify:CR=1 FL=1